MPTPLDIFKLKDVKGSATSVRSTLTVARFVTGPRFENLFKLVSLSALEQREIYNISHALFREEHVDKLLPKASDITPCAVLRVRSMHTQNQLLVTRVNSSAPKTVPPTKHSVACRCLSCE